VMRIDRLARSTFDLFGIVKRIVDAKAPFRSLAEPWADTGTSTGRLMLGVLGGLGDVERDMIRTRTGRGQEPRQGPRATYGPPPFPHTGTTEGGHQTAHTGRDVAGIGQQATTAALPPCAALRAPPRFCIRRGQDEPCAGEYSQHGRRPRNGWIDCPAYHFFDNRSEHLAVTLPGFPECILYDYN
jgi:hypothetical protein